MNEKLPVQLCNLVENGTDQFRYTAVGRAADDVTVVQDLLSLCALPTFPLLPRDQHTSWCLNSYLVSCWVSFWHCRLRRIDAFASVLWFIVMSLHLAERYLKTETPNWLDTAKFGTTSLCCLVGFTAAVATRKSTGHRKYRPRRSEPEQ